MAKKSTRKSVKKASRKASRVPKAGAAKRSPTAPVTGPGSRSRKLSRWSGRVGGHERCSASRAVNRSSTNAGTRRETSPPYVATSLTRLEARKEYSGLVGTNTVSTP